MKTKTRERLANGLKNILKNYRSVSELARQKKLSKATLLRILKCETDVHLSVLEDICKAANCDITELFPENEQTSSKKQIGIE